MARRVMRGGRSVRQTLWVGIGESITALTSANSAALIGVGNAALLALRPFTIVRTRGVYAVRSDQTGASENFSAALGACVVSDQANAIGITAVPTPFTDLGSDLFFLHQIYANRFEFISGVGIEANSAGLIQYDSKAMRKVPDGSDISFTIEASSVSLGVSIFHAGRMLIKLH